MKNNCLHPEISLPVSQTSTESFKGLCLDLYGFYLVILPLGVSRALMEHGITTFGMAKTQGFLQELYGYDCIYTWRDYVNTSAVSV